MSEIKKAALNSKGNYKQSKGNSHLTELQTIFHYLQYHIATASMITEATGIKQKNITKYKRDLEKAEMLWEIEKKACKVTGFKAWYLTANPNLAPTDYRQLKLWGGTSL
jgi:DNA-binding MarR family transcriptional regulator